RRSRNASAASTAGSRCRERAKRRTTTRSRRQRSGWGRRRAEPAMRGAVATVAAALCLVTLVTFTTRSAAAHAVLLESVPADGAALATAPAAIVLRFNEPVAPVLLRLLGPDGTTTLAGEGV